MRNRATVLLGPLAAALVLAAGCSLDWFPADAPAGGRRPFPHAPHLEGGLACGDCHASDAASGSASRTELATCLECHDDEGKPHSERIGRFYDDGGRAKGPFFAPLADEVIFDHRAHEGTLAECDVCHGDLSQSESLGREMLVDMARCTICHESRGAANDCATCHREIRRGAKPPSHDAFFARAHGLVAESSGSASQCALCHQVSTCASCHATTMPRSHDNQFRRRGHGCLAALDRSSCQACHQTDFCVRCHQGTRPTSHTASFGGTRSRHCVSCHLPVAAEPSCSVCHSGTPSHALAAPKPPNHEPGLNCRQCHGAGARLPHFDKGDDCNICHR